ncbi:DinB family protein [Nocardioides mangrovicus]|uniref:DinB family protein n=1 Tax=Nocardioides mangrovicus TaxID=2478913 RepID=A0A3L8P2D4_9ACTN|nr:DinB family protein [Nocardioides mangrovicus]RLV48578.1 DinB family protein [Nocardioides mangrovicus]
MSIEPDTKDWTWVLEQPCPDCGFDAAEVDLDALPETLRHNASAFSFALARADAHARPSEGVWSVLEYGCHVRDVHRLFGERLASMLQSDDPEFANWDQDQTAVEDRYDLQDPAQVARDLRLAADQVAERYAGVAGDQWTRPGRRSNGSVFSVDTLARYHLHDVVHHAHDIGADA